MQVGRRALLYIEVMAPSVCPALSQHWVEGSLIQGLILFLRHKDYFLIFEISFSICLLNRLRCVLFCACNFVLKYAVVLLLLQATFTFVYQIRCLPSHVPASPLLPIELRRFSQQSEKAHTAWRTLRKSLHKDCLLCAARFPELWARALCIMLIRGGLLSNFLWLSSFWFSIFVVCVDSELFNGLKFWFP